MATIKQKKAIKKVVENGGNVSRAMIDVGYSPATAKTPQKLTESKAWKELMEDYLSDESLAEAHTRLLSSNRIEHMVFPMAATDEEMIELLRSVNCEPQKIMHGEQANHVWFWSPDNKVRQAGLDMAYKLKGRYPKNADTPDDPRSLIFNILALVQNGNPRIVTSDPSGIPGASGDPIETVRPPLASEQSILDQRQAG